MDLRENPLVQMHQFIETVCHIISSSTPYWWMVQDSEITTANPRLTGSVFTTCARTEIDIAIMLGPYREEIQADPDLMAIACKIIEEKLKGFLEIYYIIYNRKFDLEHAFKMMTYKDPFIEKAAAFSRTLKNYHIENGVNLLNNPQ